MIFLTKQISKIFLIDFFTTHERQSSDNGITQKLCSHLKSNNVSTASFFPNNQDDVVAVLNCIGEDNLGDGTIIHFIGHGISNAKGFGNSQFLVNWEQIKPQLILINQNSNDGLIINATIMCHGHGVFGLIDENSRPYYAAIGSLTSNSLQGVDHNIQIYNKCYKGDFAERQIEAINNNLEYSQGIKAYEIRRS